MTSKKSVAKQPDKEPIKKVYCGECKYLSDNSFHAMGVDFPLPHLCDAPQNVGDTWRSPRSIRLFSPSDKNEKNDCDWFEQKPPESKQLEVVIHNATGKTIEKKEKKSWLDYFIGFWNK